jgi:hypothetical protein
MNRFSKLIPVVGLLSISLSADIFAAQEVVLEDFLFQFQSCDRVKTTITCLLTVMNQGQDRQLRLDASDSSMLDNLGKEIRASGFKFTSNGSNYKTLITGIPPVDTAVIFEGVAPQASNISVFIGDTNYGRFEFRNISFTNSQPQPQQKTVWNSVLFELRGCNKTGTTIKCLFTITNRIQDRPMQFDLYSKYVFDNFGNETRASDFKFTSDGSSEKTLITNIPVEAEGIFEGVSPQASNISVLVINDTLKFRHIPFSNPQSPTAFDKGKLAGRQECIANPASCGITSRGGGMTPGCIKGGCVWSLPPEPDFTQGQIPVDRFRHEDGKLWNNPVRNQPQKTDFFDSSGANKYQADHFAPEWYKNAIEGFFQIRHACQASWYSGAKDMDWIPSNVIGAIEYCVYPEKISEIVNSLRAVANSLACEGGIEKCQ